MAANILSAGARKMPSEILLESGQRSVRVCSPIALAVSLTGLAVLTGWMFDIATLKSIVPGLATMKANSALGFLLAGGSLWFSRPQAQGRADPSTAWIARALAAVVTAIGAVTLCEYVFGWSLGVDQLLFQDSGTAPGRMAVMSAINFSLLGSALMAIDIEWRGWLRPGNWLVLLIAANAFLAVLGYLYGVVSLYRVANFSSVALHTAILFLAISLGVAFARPQSHFVRQIVGNDAAAIINRRLLPAALLIPPFLGWLRWQGELAGYYSTVFGLAIYAASNVALFTALVWWSALSLQRIQEQRRAVMQSSAWQQAILNSADFTVISTDPDGVIVTINQGAANKLGYAVNELVGKTPVVIHDRDEVVVRAKGLSEELGHPVAPGFEAFVAKARLGGSDENDWTYIRRDGSRFPVRLSVTRLTDEHGKLTGFLGIGNDVTRRKEAEAAIHRMARFDTLTGLTNRNGFNEKLGEAIARSERSGQAMALLFLDLDHFKTINDTFGHEGGDLALQEFARRLQDSVRETDTVARLAGDEFVIILEAIRHADEACAVATKIVAAMQAPMRIFDTHRMYSASIGIAVRHAGEIDGEALLRRADAALYRVKETGRGRYLVEG
jgi:diguanylate cyclase (GGDEF)-like protein/PAS domain S-box-containing protein